ncbi:MAG: hypothetical protein LBR74_02915 [Eubacterium sp.]|jgi:hypothetical protein|nr:hypothetical protein [Eubacterium sp.]
MSNKTESPSTDTVKNQADENSTALEAKSVPGLIKAKPYFCVIANPKKHGFEGTLEEIVNTIIERRIEGNPQRTCAVNYCISADGLRHLHAVFEKTRQ